MIILFILICVIIYLQKQNYDKSSYYKTTNNSFLEVYLNKGKIGEYLTYKALKPYEERGDKFLFNMYIPTINNKTSELDLIMITKKGIIVFESKNYSGWIFGDEKSKMWMQILPNGKGKSCKTQFYNPILQNRGHINNLRRIINENVPVFSVIIFSDKCTLKKAPESTNYIKVIKRNRAEEAIENIYKNNPDIIGQEIVNDLYNKLYKYTQTSEEIKREHINNIRNS